MVRTLGGPRYGGRELREETACMGAGRYGRNRRYVRNGLGLGIRAVALPPPPPPTPGLDGLK